MGMDFIKGEEMKISFIVSYRGRKEMMPGLIFNIQKYYPESEIIFCSQKDNLLFRKGQLTNLGFLLARHEIIASVNLDYRFMEYVNLIAELDKHKVPVIPFSFGKLIREKELGVFEIVLEGFNHDSVGGCVVLTREQFAKSGGNTNLILGWGPDDIVLARRMGSYKKLPYTFGHVEHPLTSGGPMKARNRHVCYNPPTKPKLDGYTHTIADKVGRTSLQKDVVLYDFANIRVSNDFGYMDKYNQQLAAERKVLGL